MRHFTAILGDLAISKPSWGQLGASDEGDDEDDDGQRDVDFFGLAAGDVGSGSGGRSE